MSFCVTVSVFSWTLSESAAVLRLFACPSSQPGSGSGFAMTTTTTFKGVDPNGRNSSRVLRPPGGGSNFTLGFDEPTEQPVRKNKMASNIFGTPEENQPSWAKSAGAQSSRDNSELSGLQRRNSSEAGSGDFLGPKGEGDVHENVEADLQVDLGQNEEKSVPAAPVPSPVASAPAPSRRNPPGGKSSLVLG